MFISMYTVFNHYVTSDTIGGDETTAINAKLFGIIGMLLSLIAGRISDLIGVKNLILSALVVSTVALILMSVTTKHRVTNYLECAICKWYRLSQFHQQFLK